MTEMLNKFLVPGNACFGCGHGNERGLKIEVFRDPEDSCRLVGKFTPDVHMAGFPGLLHGGALYTALDCIAAWAPMVLRPERKALWVLRASNMRYLRPGGLSEPITLSAVIEKEDESSATVCAEARDSEGKLLARGSFETVPLSGEKFKKATGLAEIPKNWAKLIE